MKNIVCAAATAVIFAAGRTAQAGAVFGNIPLWFESSGPENSLFTAHTRGAQFQVNASGAEFILQKPGANPATVHMTFAGAGAGAEISAGDKLKGTINYLTGNDPAQWRTEVPACNSVHLDNIYPGVNVVYYGNDQNLEYDFNLAARVNPDTIAIRFDGAEKISVNAQGELVIQAGGGEILQHKPLAYQTVSGRQQKVDAGYAIVDAHTAAFKVGNFNHALPLVIDPVLGYSTYFGGNSGESVAAVVVNPSDDSIFICGQTFSTQVTNKIAFATNVVSVSAYSMTTNFNDGVNGYYSDAFVAHFDSTGTNLLYCTYLGGSKDDFASSLAVDKAGDAFVAGATDSTNFPIKNPLVYTNFNGGKISGIVQSKIGLNVYPSDAFVTELAPNGTSLVYSTYFGGSSWDYIYGIAIDPSDNAYVTGYTLSSNFPVTLSTAWQTNLLSTNNFYVNGNAFVSEISTNGPSLIYSTYLGGTNKDMGNAVCYNNGRVFVAGEADSTNFPWVNGLTNCMILNGNTNTHKHINASDAFVTAFTVNGTKLDLEYSTFLGGSNDDVATGIAADPLGNAYVVGWTVSTNFPNTTNGAQLSSFVRTNLAAAGSVTNAFLTQITWDNANAVVGYSQIFGGNTYDVANGVARDPVSGNIFVIGTTTSRTNYNAIGSSIYGSLRVTNSSTSGASDAFVTVFKSDLGSLIYSANIGGKKADFGTAIAVDTNGNAIITGETSSTNFPVLGAWTTNLTGAVHIKMDGTNDAFVARILTSGGPVLHATHSGTNVLVYWAPISDMNPTSNTPIEATSNLLNSFEVFTTNIMSVTNGHGGNIIASVVTTNFVIHWLTVTNPVPVLTGSNFIYTLNPTNPMQFYRFQPSQ